MIRSSFTAALWALFLLPLTAAAQGVADQADVNFDGEQVVAGLSQNTISITANFDGTELLIFGAVKRAELPPPGKLQVIVTVEGPSAAVTVRRKARRFGIWVNADSVEVDAAPSFYAVATSAPWDTVISDTEDLRWRISIPRAIRSVGATVSDSQSFTDALIRIRSESGLYQTLPNTVKISEETLFSTAVELPSNLVEGNYRTRVFLTRDREVVDAYESEIEVQKAGLERWLFRLSREQPLAYGVLAIVLAISLGWVASALFRYIRT
ncbi:TIGR02186 family protein [Frigidibacter sp. ROC022]|uniref:TIGR02186 family protein n=1 Tax=Frigidibacter sp. ROC022 TaxID=2971796 RepID=UPI00215AFACE|nr:TIGR02186 family protein [Frigidibacter sp. ROC022]MCR8725966.1 TIGR02186 family protein [Frigidibacter sp. ROC022]